MEGNLNIYLKEKNSITNRPNKQAKQDKCKKGTKIQENYQNESVNGGNDKHISKSKVSVLYIFDLTQILFPGKIPTTGSDSLTSKKSCMPGLLFLIKIVRKKL